MTLDQIHEAISKEKRRIEMLNNTKFIDPDFLIEETKKAKMKINSLKLQFDKEYNSQK